MEFAFAAVYPVVGGQSGTDSRKAPRWTLKESRVVAELALFGRRFQSFGPFTANEASKIVLEDCLDLLKSTGILALHPSLSRW